MYEARFQNNKTVGVTVDGIRRTYLGEANWNCGISA